MSRDAEVAELDQSGSRVRDPSQQGLPRREPDMEAAAFPAAIWSSWDDSEGESTSVMSSAALELDGDEDLTADSSFGDVAASARQRPAAESSVEYLAAHLDGSSLQYCILPHQPTGHSLFARCR